jgi:hypothetical protein
MSKGQSPCRFVYARDEVIVEGDPKPQRHITACVALIPHFNKAKQLVGVGIGASYKSPDDNPSYAEARKHALKRAASAIKHLNTSGFQTAPLPSNVIFEDPNVQEAFAGVYVDGNDFIADVPSLENIMGLDFFSTEEVKRVSESVQRIVDRFAK